MATKKSAATVTKLPQQPKRASSMRPGKASNRVKTRLVYVYGAPKTRKTGSCATLPAKWIVSDSNCIATLEALGRLPPGEDTYEVNSLLEARQVLGEMIQCAQDGSLGVDFVVLDSITALNDFHQEDIARATGQRFMGDNAKQNGWQQFNAEFGGLISDLTDLSQFVNVIVIAHAKEKFEAGKGSFSGLSLPPQMAEKAGRTANWLLYKTLRSTMALDGDAADEQTELVDLPNGGGQMKITSTLHTKPVGQWLASSNAKNLDAEESPDLLKLFEKEGLL